MPRTAIITGAASGIGKATVEHFLKTPAFSQYTIAMVDSNVQKLHASAAALTSSNHAKSITLHEADVTQSNQVYEIFHQLQGEPSILVNCAGILRDNWVDQLEERDWDTVVDVSLKGTFLMTQAFVRAYRQAEAQNPTKHEGGGAIVNVSSIVGKVGNIGQSNYAAAKAGIIGLTKTNAKELALSNIRVNAVQPGFIDTPMAAMVPEKIMNKIKPQIPMRRLGHASEVASVIGFLASEKSSYMTGGVLEVAGGLSM